MSIYLGQIGDNTSKDKLDAYKRVSANSSPGYRPVDVNRIPKQRIRLKTGGYITIEPAKIARVVSVMINAMRTNSQYSFLAPYLTKPVIWTYNVDTAATDGIRIYMNPLFIHGLLLEATHGEVEKGEENASTFWGKLNDTQREFQENIEKYNRLLTKYVRFVVVHECYHILYNHAKRAALKYGSRPTDEEHTRANYAMDLEINRDIESSFPELRGSTLKIKGIWFEHKKFYSSEGKRFNREVWEPIWDDWSKAGKRFNPNSTVKNKNMDPKQVDKRQLGAYADGWRRAVDAIKNGVINPKTVSF